LAPKKKKKIGHWPLPIRIYSSVSAQTHAYRYTYISRLIITIIQAIFITL
jgi:hypothetical protein